MRNPLVQRVFCVTRVGTPNGVTARSVFLNSHFKKGDDLQRTEYVSVQKFYFDSKRISRQNVITEEKIWTKLVLD
jgi:hypothetical protein